MQFPVCHASSGRVGTLCGYKFFCNFHVICRFCDTAFKAVCPAFSEA